ncbi:MAG: type II secretion system protein [Verrucomicrobiota bacterium]|nr:type II secretion system protein [Verrucomicrobiota bacterium]
MSQKPIKIKNAGFSLVEIAISIAIVAFGIVAILGLFANSIRGSKDTVQNTVQSLMVKERVNQAQASGMSISMTNAWTNNGVVLPLTVQYAVGTSYYDASGNVITNYTNNISMNASDMTTLKPIHRAIIRTYNLGMTNIPMSNSVPFNDKLVLFQMEIYTPAMATNNIVTQSFQTFIYRR